MESINPNDELLIEYLVSDISPEERVIVENWINASEENRRYFESLKNVWQLSGEEKALNYLLDELNVDDKWNRIKLAIAEKEDKIVSINKWIKDNDENQGQSPSRKSGIYRFFVRVAIAASVLLVIGLGWKFLASNKQEIPIAQSPKKVVDSLVAVVRHEVNTTGKEKRVQMPDGSLVVLADKSEITYQEPFANKRDITLIGKAFFKVARDKTKPFTVISGDISTTALGTEFTVTTFKHTNKIIVRLYEGKVLVKAADKTNRKLRDGVYLLPGQAFVYGGQTAAKVKEIKISSTAAPEQILNEERTRDNPSLPENAEDPYFMFNNQPLGQVLDDLAGLYNVNIVYDTKDVQNLFFIGKYNRTDSLETILRRIAILNNLTVTKKNNAFIISK